MVIKNAQRLDDFAVLFDENKKPLKSLQIHQVGFPLLLFLETTNKVLKFNISCTSDSGFFDISESCPSFEVPQIDYVAHVSPLLPKVVLTTLS